MIMNSFLDDKPLLCYSLNSQIAISNHPVKCMRHDLKKSANIPGDLNVDDAHSMLRRNVQLHLRVLITQSNGSKTKCETYD